jgi:hypothetical protein
LELLASLPPDFKNKAAVQDVPAHILSGDLNDAVRYVIAEAKYRQPLLEDELVSAVEAPLMELARVCSAVDLVETSVDAMLTEHDLDGVAVDEPGIEFKGKYDLETFAFGGYCNGRRYWRCAAVNGLGAQYMYYIPSDGAWKISDVLGDPACAYRLPDEAGTSPLDAAGAK